MKNILFLFIFFILLIALFYLICYCVSLCTGCTMDEAIKKVQSLLRSDTPTYHIANDSGLFPELHDTLHSIVGDTRYNKLLGLSRQTPIIQSGVVKGLRCIGIVVPYASDNEKVQAEKIFTGILVRYLIIYGFDSRVHTSWTSHPVLGLPVIFLAYAETKEESEILSRTIQDESRKAVRQFKPPIDEDIDHD